MQGSSHVIVTFKGENSWMEHESDADRVYGQYMCKKHGGNYMLELTEMNLNVESLAGIVAGLQEFRRNNCKNCPADCPTRKLDELLNLYRSGLAPPP